MSAEHVLLCKKKCRKDWPRRSSLAKWEIMLMYALGLAVLLSSTQAVENEEEEVKHTEIDQANSIPETEYSEYSSNPSYTKERSRSSVCQMVNCLGGTLADFFASNKTLPKGYIAVKNEKTLVFGPKVNCNDWRDLLQEYVLALCWVILLLVLIIIMPFIAVCYCCFCCCKRCPRGCPSCDRQGDNRKRICCSIILILLLIGIIVGLFFAICASTAMERGFAFTKTTIQRAGEDACTFLKDTARHLEHLFVTNFEELDSNIKLIHNDSLEKILFDLARSAGYKALADLFIILKNIDSVIKALRTIRALEDNLNFYGGQLRDGIRTVKREVTHACTTLCGSRECLKFLESTYIETLDASPCLHFDNLPNTDEFIKELSSFNAAELFQRIYDIENTIAEIAVPIQVAVDRVMIPITMAMHDLGKRYRNKVKVMHRHVEMMISKIHFQLVLSNKTLGDAEVRFGKPRHIVNVILLVMVAVIIVLLVVALIFGLCSPVRQSDATKFFSRSTAAICLLIAIMLIFAIVSTILLIGLFYFVLGTVAHQGVCAPIRYREGNSLFRQLDSQLDLRRYFEVDEKSDDDAVPLSSQSLPLRISTALKTCKDDLSIFKLLKYTKTFDVFSLKDPNVTWDQWEPTSIFNNQLDNFTILAPEQVAQLENLTESETADLKSELYFDVLCKNITPVALPKVVQQIRKLESSLKNSRGKNYDEAKTALRNAALDLEKYNDRLVGQIRHNMEKIKQNALTIKKITIYNGYSFGDTLEFVLEGIQVAEKYVQTKGENTVRLWITNLKHEMKRQVLNFPERAIDKCYEEVGRCRPLAYAYKTGVDLICDRLVLSLNGFWVGMMLCGLLLLPTIYVAHRLMCLFKKIYPPVGGRSSAGIQCRFCAGAFALADRNDKPDSMHIVHNEVSDSSCEPGLATSTDAVLEKPSGAEESVASPHGSTPSGSSSISSSKHKQE